jgi:CRISPR system Cascade subunit CasE
MINSSAYFSRVELQIAPASLQMIATPYELHRTLWRLFPETAERDFLFRVHESFSTRSTTIEISIVSKTKPHFDLLKGLIAAEQSREYQPKLKQGDKLHFEIYCVLSDSLRAESTDRKMRSRGRKVDPVVKALFPLKGEARSNERLAWVAGTSEADEIDGMPIFQPAKLASHWLAPRLKKVGFSLDLSTARVRQYEQDKFLGRKSSEHEIRYSTALFDGQVVIDDPTLAMTTLTNGFGRGKALGCGLMFVRRVFV